jgi:hypothetical protein
MNVPRFSVLGQLRGLPVPARAPTRIGLLQSLRFA